MLESQSCLISRALPSSCEQESKWVYMTYRLIEVSNGKRRLEDEGEELVERKSLKRVDAHENEENTQTPNNLSLSLAIRSDEQGDRVLNQIDMNCGLSSEDEGKESLLGDGELCQEMETHDRQGMNGIMHDFFASPTIQFDQHRNKASEIDMNCMHPACEEREGELFGSPKSSKPLEQSGQQVHAAEETDMICIRCVEGNGEEELLEKINSSKGLDMDEEEEMTNTPQSQLPSSATESDVQFHVEANCMLPLEDKTGKILWEGESSNGMETNQREEMTHTLNDLVLSPADQANQVHHAADQMDMNEDLVLFPVDQDNPQDNDGDQGDMDSLIQPLNRDISIHCLLRCSRSEYNSLASLNRSFRNLIRNGELYRLRRQNGVIEHWVYFSCHVLQWEAFDPISRRWMHLPPMPSNECFMLSDKESLAVGTELLVFGKEITSHVIWRYSILTNSWSSGMEMNSPRCLFGSASLGEIAILAGGCDSRGRVLNSAELYNSETGTWETLPSMNKPRKMCSGVFMDGKFYVIGGRNTEWLNCGEEYNLETRTWREIPNMFPRQNGPTEAPPLVAVVNNELYAADYTENELRKFDKESTSWVTVGRLPERAVSMNGWGLAFRACGEHLIVIGGPRALGGGIIELNSWIPNDGPPQWNLLATRHSGNFVYNCAVMGC